MKCKVKLIKSSFQIDRPEQSNMATTVYALKQEIWNKRFEPSHVDSFLLYLGAN